MSTKEEEVSGGKAERLVRSISETLDAFVNNIKTRTPEVCNPEDQPLRQDPHVLRKLASLPSTTEKLGVVLTQSEAPNSGDLLSLPPPLMQQSNDSDQRIEDGSKQEPNNLATSFMEISPSSESHAEPPPMELSSMPEKSFPSDFQVEFPTVPAMSKSRLHDSQTHPTVIEKSLYLGSHSVEHRIPVLQEKSSNLCIEPACIEPLHTEPGMPLILAKPLFSGVQGECSAMEHLLRPITPPSNDKNQWSPREPMSSSEIPPAPMETISLSATLNGVEATSVSEAFPHVNSESTIVIKQREEGTGKSSPSDPQDERKHNLGSGLRKSGESEDEERDCTLNHSATCTLEQTENRIDPRIISLEISAEKSVGGEQDESNTNVIDKHKDAKQEFDSHEIPEFHLRASSASFSWRNLETSKLRDVEISQPRSSSCLILSRNEDSELHHDPLISSHFAPPPPQVPTNVPQAFRPLESMTLIFRRPQSESPSAIDMQQNPMLSSRRLPASAGETEHETSSLSGQPMTRPPPPPPLSLRPPPEPSSVAAKKVMAETPVKREHKGLSLSPPETSQDASSTAEEPLFTPALSLSNAASVTCSESRGPPKLQESLWRRTLVQLLEGGPASVPVSETSSRMGPMTEGPVSQLTSNFHLDLIGRLIYDLQKNSASLGVEDDKAVLAISDNFDEIVRHRASQNPSAFLRSKVVKMGKLEKVTALSKKKFAEHQTTIQELKAEVESWQVKWLAENARTQKLENDLQSLQQELDRSINQTTALESKLQRRPSFQEPKFSVVGGVSTQLQNFVEVRNNETEKSTFVSASEVPGETAAKVRFDSVIVKQDLLERLQFENLKLSQELASLHSSRLSQNSAASLPQTQQKEPEGDSTLLLQKKLDEQRKRLTSEAATKVEYLKQAVQELTSQNQTLRQKIQLQAEVIARHETVSAAKTQVSDAKSPNEEDHSSEIQTLKDQLRHKDFVINSLTQQMSLMEQDQQTKISESPPNQRDSEPASKPLREETLTSSQETSSKSHTEEFILLQARHEQLRHKYLELQTLTGPETASREAAHQRIFLKSALMKFLESDPPGSPEHEGLVPVIMRLLNLTSEEIRLIESKRPAGSRLKIPFLR